MEAMTLSFGVLLGFLNRAIEEDEGQKASQQCDPLQSERRRAGILFGILHAMRVVFRTPTALGFEIYLRNRH